MVDDGSDGDSDSFGEGLDGLFTEETERVKMEEKMPRRIKMIKRRVTMTMIKGTLGMLF